MSNEQNSHRQQLEGPTIALPAHAVDSLTPRLMPQAGGVLENGLHLSAATMGRADRFPCSGRGTGRGRVLVSLIETAI